MIWPLPTPQPRGLPFNSLDVPVCSQLWTPATTAALAYLPHSLPSYCQQIDNSTLSNVSLLLFVPTKPGAARGKNLILVSPVTEELEAP